MYLRVLNELYLLYNIYTIKVQNIKKFIIHLYAASGATSDQYHSRSSLYTRSQTGRKTIHVTLYIMQIHTRFHF
jgi:hypothetical protein